jgi:hypothetical protein
MKKAKTRKFGQGPAGLIGDELAKLTSYLI